MKETVIGVLGDTNNGVVIVRHSNPGDAPQWTSLTICLPGLEWRVYPVDPYQIKQFAEELIEASKR